MGAVDRAITSGHSKAPKGVRGFLLFFCLILIVISPAIWIILEVPLVKSGEFDRADLIGALHQLYGIFTGIWIWSGQKSGKKAAFIFLVVTVVIAFVYAVLSPTATTGPGNYSPILFSVIWWRYFRTSERVKNTYAEAESNSSAIGSTQLTTSRHLQFTLNRAMVLTGISVVLIALLLCAFSIRKSRQAKAQERVRAGEIYWRTGQKQKAISAYKEALRFDYGNSDIWRGLAAAYEASKDFPEAIKAYERAANLAPHEPRIRESLGTLFDRAGMPSDARMAYAKALSLYNADIALHPTYGFLYRSIGDLEQRLGESEKAAAAYRSAFTYYLKRNDPSDWFEWEFLGDAWLKLGQPDDAISAYERAVAAKPDIESTQMKLRKLKYAQGRRLQ